MNNRPNDPKTARNKNVLVIGGSGSGKTRFFVKPNLMQCVSKDYPTVPFPVSWTVKMKKKQKETQDILSYHIYC